MESKPVRIEELLAHAGWVRRLAARLVRDAGTADDVAQEVWAYALRSPPRDRSNLRAWLSAAVRNAARSLQRSQARRAEREAAVPLKGHEPAAAELVERAHLHRDLVEQVLALDEPHRSIVLAYWFEEQSLVEIARRQGLTERVVKSRLDEAHSLLRQRMDGAAGGREVWSLAFLKWTDPQLATGATAGAGSALTLGGVVVASKLVIAGVVVVVAAGVGWILWPRGEPITPLARDMSVPAVRAASTTPENAELAAGVSPSARETVESAVTKWIVPTAAQKQRWVLRGHVHGAPAGRESETKITAQFIGRFNIQDRVSGPVASDGSFEFDVTGALTPWLRGGDPNELQVLADHPVCQVAEVRLPFASATKESGSPGRLVYDCECTLVSAAVATGRVIVPPDWKPGLGMYAEPLRPGVALFDFSSGAPPAEGGIDHAICDGEGRWVLRASHGGAFTVVAAVDGLRPSSVSASLVLGQSTEVGSLELSRGLSISGRVLRAGRPVGAGTEVYARAKFTSYSRIVMPTLGNRTLCLNHSGGREFEFELTYATTLGDGSFSLDGLAPVKHALEVLSLPGMRMGLGRKSHIERTVQSPQSGVELEGVPPTIQVVVTVDGRAPTDQDLEGEVFDLVDLSEGGRTSEMNMTRSSLGYGKISLAENVAYELRVRPGRYATAVIPIGPLSVGEERTFALDLKPDDQAGTLVVRFESEQPETLATVNLALVDPRAAPADEVKWQQVERSKEGTFVLSHLPAGRYRLLVNPFDYWAPPSASYFMPTACEVVLPAKATVSEFVRLGVGGRMRTSVKDDHGGYIRAAAELRDSTGDLLPTDFYCLSSKGLMRCGWCVDGQGPNDHPPLPAGHYEFTLKAEGFATEVVPVDLIAGETKTLDVVLHPK